MGAQLYAFAAGILAQAARVSLRSAFRNARGARALAPGPAAAVLVAACLTTIAVHLAG